MLGGGLSASGHVTLVDAAQENLSIGL